MASQLQASRYVPEMAQRGVPVIAPPDGRTPRGRSSHGARAGGRPGRPRPPLSLPLPALVGPFTTGRPRSERLAPLDDRRQAMYPISIYPPVRQLDDPAARVRVPRRPRGEDRAALRWRPLAAA